MPTQAIENNHPYTFVNVSSASPAHAAAPTLEPPRDAARFHLDLPQELSIVRSGSSARGCYVELVTCILDRSLSASISQACDVPHQSTSPAHAAHVRIRKSTSVPRCTLRIAQNCSSSCDQLIFVCCVHLAPIQSSTQNNSVLQCMMRTLTKHMPARAATR